MIKRFFEKFFEIGQDIVGEFSGENERKREKQRKIEYNKKLVKSMKRLKESTWHKEVSRRIDEYGYCVVDDATLQPISEEEQKKRKILSHGKTNTSTRGHNRRNGSGDGTLAMIAGSVIASSGSNSSSGDSSGGVGE